MHGVAWQAPSPAEHAAWGPVYAQLLREWIAAGESAWVPLTGDSMGPFLPSGSKVLICRAAPGRIVPGDLVVFEDEGRMICHRVLRRRPQGLSHAFLTKGDGWRTTDPWVRTHQVIGKVIAMSRGGRVVRLETPLRRLQAVAAVARSLVGIGSRVILRRARRVLRPELSYHASSRE